MKCQNQNDATFQRHTVKNHWFVSVAVPKQGRIKTFVRLTEIFPTEADAKQFAKKQRHVFAGTLLSYYFRLAGLGFR